jgi:hypothetical protein
MGAWGDKLFQDDTAQEARDAYKAILSKGLDGTAATDEFLKQWKDELDDSDDGPTVWFALADTQWKLGRLEPRVQKRAISLIDKGSSLDRWREAGPKELAKRQRILDDLKERWTSPQPKKAEIKVKAPSKIATWTPGELISYRLASGKQVILCLEEIHEGHHARLSALDWVGDEVPVGAALNKLKRKRLHIEDLPKATGYTHWRVLALRKRDVPYSRMRRLNHTISLAPGKEGFAISKSWAELDEQLSQFFGWK